ncbi:MAG: DnaD domain protein [Oscillospiraceae bacterium]|nr:DnaD domain protein [Oscillospiraceae bacterium]
MDYDLNMGQWNSIFAIPKAVVDRHLKMVGSTQLKVLLWILRHSDENFSVGNISKSLFIHPADVKDALQYWVESEILVGGNLEIGNKEKNDFEEKKEEKKYEKFEKKSKEVRVLTETDGEYIANRINGCEDISLIIKEAEIILGDKFSRGIIPVLISFYDDYGLPADVIVMILQYAVRAGKNNVRYIKAVGVSWAEEGIDTIEKAEKKIKSLDNMNVIKEKFEKVIDSENYKFSSSDLKTIDKWFNNWNYSEDMVREAYDRCLRIKGKFILKYMDGTLKNWKNEGIYNAEQLKIGNQRVRNNNCSDSGKSTSYASYNIEDYRNYCKSILLGDKKLGEK